MSPIAPPTQRLMDLAFALPAVLALAPAMAVIALLIRLTSPGPALFRQQRVGQNGRLFTIYKFRTLKLAPETTSELAVHDPRITAIGRFLRRFSLDELPQLLNVLEGHMSLVGPRPTIPEQATKYDAWQRRRLEVKPGLTGWAQVNGRNALSWEERFALDVWYVDHRSARLDLTILARTFQVVVSGRGLYGADGLNRGF